MGLIKSITVVTGFARCYLNLVPGLAENNEDIKAVQRLIQELADADRKRKEGDDAGFVGDFLAMYEEIA